MSLGVLYLFEILHTSSTLKNKKNVFLYIFLKDVSNMDVSKRFCNGECKSFNDMKKQCQVSCVKLFFKLIY